MNPRCDRQNCRRRAYWILPDGRGYCTAIHMRDEIGDRPWTAGPQRSDDTRLVALQ